MINSAVIAITLNCNSRCKMCDIWKSGTKNEVKASFYSKLPRTLKDINITGGEPFLRQDLPEIVKVMKKACPKARILINTNGFTPKVVEVKMLEILKIDPKIAVRVSLDGWKDRHNKIRGIPGGFDKCLESLRVMKKIGVKDLGIAFTLMKENVNDLIKLFYFSKKEKLNFSLTLVSSSDIYFGKGKAGYRPDNSKKLTRDLKKIIEMQYLSFKIRYWLQAWFNNKLYSYFLDKKRGLACNAGDKWVYIDSTGGVYSCHLKPWKMGDLKKESFENIYTSKHSDDLRCQARKCDDCWMVCSAKTSMQENKLKVIFSVIKEKISIFFNHS